ncbi:hypothetical protein [Bacteroides stercoris]|jgi:hypothetical protein|uniref:hypothetical protein n=1 Tax=Bacteroides stercoris TaxID=46506 RepID=UPI00359C6B00
MNKLFEQRFFRLLSEYSQKKFTINELMAALQELANHLASVAIHEQDYAVLLRYFSFGLNRLKSYRSQFETGEKCLITAY